MINNRNVNIVCSIALIVLISMEVYAEVAAWWFVMLALIYVGLQVYGATVLSAEYFVKVYSCAPTHEPAIAITFDDGPVPGKTDKILDVLSLYNITAAFFCIGNRIRNASGLLQRIHSEGHLIGNHSYWHGKFFDLQSASAIENELTETDEVIDSVIQVTPRFFRPPYGVTNPMVASAIKSGNYVTVGWSVRSFDTVVKNEKKLFERVTRNLRNGDIVLFHDFSDATIAILPAFIEHVKQLGLKIVRVDQLLNERAYV